MQGFEHHQDIRHMANVTTQEASGKEHHWDVGFKV